MFMLKLYKLNQGKIVIFAVLIAFILGRITPNIFTHLNFISDSFLNLLKLCALPIVLTSLITNIGNMPNLSKLKQVALNSLIYIILTEVIAVSIGLVVFNLVDISNNIDANSLFKGVKYTGSNSTQIDYANIFNYIFSSNIFKSLANFDVLPIVIFSIIFGITCGLNQDKSKHILDFMQSMRETFLSLLYGIMYLAPLAIFVLVGNSIASSYLSGSLAVNLIGLLKFVGFFFVALFIHFLWQLLLVVWIYRHLGFKKILKASTPIFTTAFISSSSLATLPIALNTAIELGGKKKVVNFMLPICASMNFASGMMYEITACLFFMKVLGYHPDITQQIFLAITCILTGIIVGGIPETSMVSFVIVFGMANIPLSAIAILLPLDRFIDRVRTMVNIFGNTCGTMVVSKTIKD